MAHKLNHIKMHFEFSTMQVWEEAGRSGDDDGLTMLRSSFFTFRVELNLKDRKGESPHYTGSCHCQIEEFQLGVFLSLSAVANSVFL